MKTCSHFDLKVDQKTMIPYKLFCYREITGTGDTGKCSRHVRSGKSGRPKRGGGPPRSEDVSQLPEARRYEGPSYY